MLKTIINKLLVFLELKSPPDIIPTYHIPLKQLTGKYHEVIHADVKFKPKEREQIIKAVQEWNIFCNNLLTLEVKFDYESTDKLVDEPILHRVKSSHERIKKFQSEHNMFVLGLCCVEKGRVDMYLVYERIHYPLSWKTITLHEIGHFLGLNHTEGKSIMMRTHSNYPSTLNKIDAVEFAKVFNLDPDDLVYAL